MSTQIAVPKLMTPSSLCQVVGRLIEILTIENEHLRARQSTKIKDSLAEKTRLVAIYNQQMGLIKLNTKTFSTYPKVDIDRLKQMSETFYAVMDEHFRMLSNIRTVTEGIVRAVAEEVQKKNRPVSGYDASAAVNQPSNKTVASYGNNAISINQVI